MANKSRYNFLTKLLSSYLFLGIFLIFIGLLVILTPIAPTLWYNLNKDAIDEEIISITEVSRESVDKLPDNFSKELNLPPKDFSLPETNMLIIPSIGVNGPINENKNGKDGLELGIWRTHDWGTPEDDVATILAAHRFGYIYWTPEFRKTQSFYNLPKTHIGDEVSVVWNQREYKYKIYKEETGKAFSDLDADLILYTCQWFDTPIRVFRYLERTN